MNLGRYLAGCLALVAIMAPVACVAWQLRRRLLPRCDGASARLAESVLAISLLLWLAELLGLVGALRLGWLVLSAWALGAFAWFAVRRAGPVAHGPVAHELPPTPPADRWLLGLMVGAVGIVFALWLRRTLMAYQFGMGGVDTLWFHAPIAARFVQDASIVHLPHLDVEFHTTAFYPANGELLDAVGILGFGRDIASPALNLLWAALALLAAWCVGRRFSAAPLGVIGVALAVATPTMVLSQAGESKSDVLAIALLLAAVAMLLERGTAIGPTVIGGLAAGLAVGTKLSLAIPVAVLGVVVAVLAARRDRLRVSVCWVGAAVLAGGVWFARNLIAVGNPFPIVNLGPLPRPAPALEHGTDFAVSHYLFDAHAWHDFLRPGLGAALGPWWGLTLALAGAALLVLALRARTRSARLLAMLSVVSLVGYLFTPETAAGPDGQPFGFALNVRYAVPALALALVLLPWARLPPRGYRVLGALLAGGLIAEASAPYVWPTGHRGATIVVVLGVLVVLAVLLWFARKRPRLVACALAVGVGVVVGGGFRRARSYLANAYTAAAPGFTSWSGFGLEPAYRLARSLHHARIGVAGTSASFFEYPLYGPDLTNRVRTVGRLGAHGSFTPIASCVQWRIALARGGIRYVVITPTLDAWHPFTPAPTPQLAWTLSDPSATPLIRNAALISVFRLAARVDLRGC